jgi:hypothetical protein
MKDLLFKLLDRLNAPKSAFFSLGKVQWHQLAKSPRSKDQKGFTIFIPGKKGNRVLAVAHLDTVLREDSQISKTLTGNYEVWSPQLDDRLGAWVLLDVLPQFGLAGEYDILLTDLEEVGQSTAEHFKTNKKYNWIFEFDRQGTDVVMYEYDTPKHRELLTDAGFEVGIGSFTDICYLEHLGCAGFNFGVGYHGQHSKNCYAKLRDTLGMVAKFRRFFHEHKDTHLAWKPSDTVRHSIFSDDDWYRSSSHRYLPSSGATKQTYQSYDEWYLENGRDRDLELEDRISAVKRGNVRGQKRPRLFAPNLCEECGLETDQDGLCRECDYPRIFEEYRHGV